MSPPFDPALDLRIARDIAAPPERLWRAWVEPELLKRWFCPVPWRVVDARIDPRPGGIFWTRMAGPDGAEVTCEGDGSAGCFLTVEPHRRLVWTDALGPDFRPNPTAFLTTHVHFDPLPGGGTRYEAVAIHASPEIRQRHLEMGFEEGWGATIDQLAELCAKELA